MITPLKVAWYQLSFHKMKLAVAVAGVVVAVMLMLVQLGIRQGALDNCVAIATKISADLVVVSPRTRSIFQPAAFPRRLLYRLPSHPDVEQVREAYMGQARFRTVEDHREMPISIYGVDPRDPMFHFPGFDAFSRELQLADCVVFDGLSRRTFGPIAKQIAEGKKLETEVNYRKVQIVGTVNVGISINTDGNLYTSTANFLRLFPARDVGAIDLGLVRLKPGADPIKVCRELAPLVGNEAKLLTKEDLLTCEIRFVRDSAPLDFIFGMGAAVGFFIGFVVVYQILYTEVTNHLPHYATLKAMGFSDYYLQQLVLTQAIILSILGYAPGFVLALFVYQIASYAIEMPFGMTWFRGTGVLMLTVVMCGLSGIIAIQKARTADPADVF